MRMACVTARGAVAAAATSVPAATLTCVPAATLPLAAHGPPVRLLHVLAALRPPVATLRPRLPTSAGRSARHHRRTFGSGASPNESECRCRKAQVAVVAAVAIHSPRRRRRPATHVTRGSMTRACYELPRRGPDARTVAPHTPPRPPAPAPDAALTERNLRIGLYGAALAIGVLGLSYAAVPLYQLFCQATGYGGTTQQADPDKFKSVRPVPGARQLTIYFNADTTDTMPWSFKPLQASVKVRAMAAAAAAAPAADGGGRASARKRLRWCGAGGTRRDGPRLLHGSQPH